MTAGVEAFYRAIGGNRFAATEHTGGPWDPAFQHGGPPSALLARAVAAQSPSWSATVTRMSVDILGPIPITELEVRSRVLRPGRSVDLVEAEMEASGRTVARAQAWRVRVADLDLPPLPGEPAAVPPLPDEPAALPAGWTGGYLHAMEWRVAAGDWGQRGPATIWGRMRVPLVEGEEPTGLQRMMTIADSGNGASNVLPVTGWLFINPELTVHVAAEPAGEWICLDASTCVDRRGFGLAESRLFDRDRLVGRGAQSLLIAPR